MSAADELAALLQQIQSAPRLQLSRRDLRAFPALYRRVISELAEARARNETPMRARQLEALITRAHGILYAPKPAPWRDALGHVADVVATFPRAVRGARSYVALACALTLAGTAFGYGEVRRDVSSAVILLPGFLQQNAEESFQDDAQTQQGSPVRGVFYFTHNASVAFDTFALGATLGVGTVLLLLFNGVILGATSAVVQTSASPRAFLSFILPHAGVELLAIMIAAAGGLRIADAMLRPGWRTRKDAFGHAGREALILALGAACMLGVAGLLEGWISPMPLPVWQKAAVGVSVDVATLLYLLWKPQRRVGSESAARGGQT